MDSAAVALISVVIQGSCIGPLLFVMFINELAEDLRSFGVTVKLFADDLKMYLKLTNSTDIHTLQDALDYLSSWSVMWQLPISITKCFATIVADSLHLMLNFQLTVFLFHTLHPVRILV